MREILDSGASFTAVLASNDESAIGAMTALRDAGLRVPHDIAIVGFDDSLEAVIQAPPLTTLHCSPFEMGFRALELLLEYIEGRKKDHTIVQVPMRLVIRQSCGCQPDTKIEPRTEKHPRTKNKDQRTEEPEPQNRRTTEPQNHRTEDGHPQSQPKTAECNTQHATRNTQSAICNLQSAICNPAEWVSKIERAMAQAVLAEAQRLSVEEAENL